jgi:hypothetical protein
LAEKMPCRAYSGDMYPLYLGNTRHIRKVQAFDLNSTRCILVIGDAKALFTYYVPAMRLVFPTLESMLNSLARPKSEILGFMFASSKMLLALRSRWMMVSLESSWR